MTTPLQFFRYFNQVLCSDKVSLLEIAHSVNTPCYIYSARGFLDPLKTLQKELSAIDHLICFAVKSNSNCAILKLLSKAGTGVDLVSAGELFRAKKARISGEKIVFSGVGKTSDEMKMALEYPGNGIFSFNVESISELLTLNKMSLQLEKRANVALRFNPDINAKTHPYISTGLKKNKFGMTYSEIIKLVQILPTLPGVCLRGISIHIGSQLLDLTPLEDAFIKLKNLITELKPYLKDPIRFVDLGGGLGITYHDEVAPSLKQYCQLIRKHFCKTSLKVLIEPGRTLSGNAGILITKIQYLKERKGKNFIILDAGMNDLIRPALYQSHHEIIPLKKPSPGSRMQKFDIFGPVCESADCFAHSRLLPSNLKEGDYLAILSAGAYGFSMASNYNSRVRPSEVLIADKGFKVIRDRENFEDLIRGERY